MAYVSVADLSARLGAPLYARLTDRAGGASADDTVGQRIVDEAEAEVDALLAPRYRTPLDLAAHPELAPLLRARALDLAEYIAWKSSPFVSDPPQRVKEVYAAARGWLAAVAAGAAALPAQVAPAGPARGEGAPRASSQPRVFTSAELDGL